MAIATVSGLAYDGDEEIIYTGTFNIYNNELKLKVEEYIFKFLFQKADPIAGQKDIQWRWDREGLPEGVPATTATITISNRFRNTLGSALEKKLTVIELDSGGKILFSIFGQKTGESIMNVTVCFYRT